ncbi:50S ribosomal protein L11 methyltransferase [Salidesulfovibrio brasiliensis]|uniref:50S ribosomal protein L11 methyltransferase n=1 Tax=Salidesulfovibrio brasiliensis TaxID=221711 RepID=UPI0006D236C5|nr:50S ribosomal protein L11 methyltransferase [Salidesulfovibrio brasiliensis]
MTTLLKIEFSVAGEELDECVEFLSAKVPHGWEEIEKNGRFHYTVFLEDHPLGMELVAEIKDRFPDGGLSHNEQESENWAMAWKDFFAPVSCGDRFEILPPWMADASDDGMTHIVIEPKMAFGTGHHPTTSLCLELIGELSKEGRIDDSMNFLDLGTGSGILAIGLAKLGLDGLAVDIDPQAVVCARENIQNNDTEDAIALSVGGVESIAPEQQYDLVVANILSGPLIEMAGELVEHVKDGGCLILSGILGEQGERVAAAYRRRGLPAPEIFTQGEWVALLWREVGR